MEIKNKQSGFSLTEMLVYIAVLTLISIVIVNIALSFTQTYRQLTALRAVEHSGIDAMERMTRDIRASASASVSGGALTLTNSTTTTRFYLDSSILKVDVNGVYIGPLTLSNASITSLTFTPISNTNTQAVKIDMTASGTDGTVTKSKTYHSTIILRGI